MVENQPRMKTPCPPRAMVQVQRKGKHTSEPVQLQKGVAATAVKEEHRTMRQMQHLIVKRHALRHRCGKTKRAPKGTRSFFDHLVGKIRHLRQRQYAL